MTRTKKPITLIIGSHGMLGSELIKQALKYTNWQIVTSDVSDEGGIDITNADSVTKYFDRYIPDIVINCAAFTNVDACETKQGFSIAKKVNGYGPGILAKAAIKHNALFIHISTDYVFGDEKKSGYAEGYSKFKPINKYAKSKLLGEREVIKAYGGLKKGKKAEFKIQEPKGYIIRTSWLFGQGAKNFIAKIIELAGKLDRLKVVTDEVSCPTYVKDLSQRLIFIAEQKPANGIYHAAGRGAASRYEFARQILRCIDSKTPLFPTTLKEFKRTIKVPHYSVLLNTKLPIMRKWQDMVKDYFQKSK